MYHANAIDALIALRASHQFIVQLDVELNERHNIVQQCEIKFGRSALEYHGRRSEYAVFLNRRWFSTGTHFHFLNHRDAINFKLHFC